MALFKIHKGERFPDSGQITKATEGFAYFTTDDGKFYIDIAGDGTTDAIIRDKEHPLGNRVPLNAAQADYVKNNFILRIANGNTEDNNLYTFNGSETKQLNFQADNGINFISAQNSLTIGINASEINTGILRTGFGGTGNDTYVANRLIYSETENKLNSTSNISTDGNSIHFLKDDGNYVLISNKYNDVSYTLLRDHHNGNISLSASSGSLHLGYSNTTGLYLYAGKDSNNYFKRSIFAVVGNNDTSTTPTNEVIVYGSGGGLSQPVYVDTYGKVQSITGTLNNDINGNADTATAANITSTDNAIVRFNGTAGEFQNSKALVDDSGGITLGGSYLTIKPYSSAYDTTGSHVGIRFYFNHDKSGYNADTLITSYSLQATNFYGALKGNADTATQFKDDTTVQLTGDVTGSASGTHGWSIATTIPTNSIANNKLINSQITIAGNTISLGDTLNASTLKNSLGLANAMHFRGIATVTIEDGSTTDPEISNNPTTDLEAGDVVIDSNSSYEYVWDGSKWERLGQDASTTYNSGTIATNQWIANIQQNSDRTITTTLGTLDTSGTWSGVAEKANAANITSTDNAIVRFDGTEGKFQNSQVLVDDNGGITSNSAITVGSGYFIIKPFSSAYDTTGTHDGIKFYFNHNGENYNPDTLITYYSLQATNFYGALKGNADTATKVNNTLTITLNNSAKTFNGSADTSISFYAPTTGGAANTQALVGNGATTAPKWVNISPSITITAGTASATPKVNVTVLGQSGTAQAITTATTGVYGATKLTDAYTSTDATLAATGKSILAAIQTLDVTAVGVAAATGNRYISQISETDGKISAVLATATIGTTTTPIWVDAGTIKPGSYELKATVDNGTQHYLTMYTTADGRTIGPASDRASTVLLSSTVADTLKLTSSANTNYLTYTSSIGTWKTGMGENADEYWIYSNSLSNWRIAIDNSNFHLRSSSYQKNTTPSSNASGAGIYTRDTDNNYIWILRGYKSTSNTMGVQLCTYGHSTNDTGTSTFAIYRTSTPDTYINWTGGKIGNSIYPWANATYNIGSNDLAWNQLHLTYDSSSARNKGIRFMNTGTLVGNIGATAQGLGIYGNGHLYLRPSLTETQGMEITSTAVQPATDHDINLGTTSLRWNQIHAKSYYIEDTRNEDLTAATNDKAIRFFFSSNNMPDSKYWSGIHVRGWNGGYSSWELVGPAHNVDQSTTPLYIKTSNINTGWGEWRPILDSYNGVMRFHYGGTGTTTKILITINNTSSWMVSFTLRLYQGYQATDLQISGYNYNNTDTPWSSPQAIVLGSTAYDGPLVYFGYTDTQKLWIAVDGARYTGVDVFGVTNGYTQINLKDFCTITNVSTLPGTLQTTVRAYSRLAHNVVSDTGDITLHNQPGTFAFSGNGDPWSGNDWVGFQVGNNADKFQIVRVNSNNLLFRQNDSGGVNTSWGTWEKILTDVNTSWAAWTAGTTAGPQANLSLSGTNIRSAAIPSASTSASGIVTTAAQTFAGTKTFTNPETINSTGNGAAINFKFSNAASANTIYGQNWITYANNGGRFYWREWGGTANGRTAGYEQYCLPACNAGRTTTVTYDIFTSKNQAEPSKGTANRAAYYSAADTIEDAGSIYMDTTTIGFLKDNGAYDLIKNTYNSTSYHLLYDHHNGNISLSASSLGLYLGYYDTTLIDFLHSAGAWNSTGLGIGTTSPDYKLDVRGTGYFTNTVHINKNSGTGLVDADTAPLLIGTLTGASLAIGNNAIQARSNHTESKLWFNYEGGSTSFGSSTSKTAPTTFFGTVTPGANNTYDLGSETLRWQQIHGNLNGARAYSNGTKQNWEKVATWSGSCKNVNDDTSLTLSISDGYPNPSNTPHHNGLLYINFRGSSNSTTAGRTHCKWIVGNNITPDDWVLTYKITSAYAITVNLYVNCTSSWQSWNIVKINEHTWGTTVNEWQLLDASSGIESLPTNETQIISTLSDISNTVPNVRIANGNGTVKYFVGVNSTGSQQLYYNSSIHTTTSNVLMGAAWNDYAEFRQLKENKMYATTVKPGRVVYENGDDTLSISSNRLMRGCSIVSDTYGFGIGESEKAQLPVAVSGRVLAYPYEDREKFKNHIGWPVCSGPNGTVSIMTEEEEIKYPSRIIGIISAVPDYEIWHGGADVKVNGRVWIKVR